MLQLDYKLRSQCSHGKRVHAHVCSCSYLIIMGAPSIGIPFYYLWLYDVSENYFWKRSSTTSSNFKLAFKCYAWQHICKTTSQIHQNQSLLNLHSLSQNQHNISDRMAVHTSQYINFTFVHKIDKKNMPKVILQSKVLLYSAEAIPHFHSNMLIDT